MQLMLATINFSYDGLSLAVEIDKEYATLDFNINPARLTEFNKSHD